MTVADVEQYHFEVVEALRAIGNPRYGESVRVDRGSHLEHLGIGFPELRKRVKQGFSFYALPAEEVMAIWDGLWRESPYGDVLFAALEYYLPRARKHAAPAGLWPVAREWVGRVDNWCHCDVLSNLYSHLLEQDQVAVFPQLVEWNESEDLWQRRASLVSLIHYSGKNAVFLEPAQVLPLVTNCLGDDRHYIQTAAGWVLREMGNVYPGETLEYLERNSGSIGAKALMRATERMSPAERARLRELRTKERAT